MSFDKEFLTKIKKQLEEEKERLESELNTLARPTATPGEYETKFDEIGNDADENASEIEEYADNLAIENNLETQLKEVCSALEKIANGGYGFCENCQQKINPERLLAYPAAKTCIKCN